MNLTPAHLPISLSCQCPDSPCLGSQTGLELNTSCPVETLQPTSTSSPSVASCGRPGEGIPRLATERTNWCESLPPAACRCRNPVPVCCDILSLSWSPWPTQAKASGGRSDNKVSAPYKDPSGRPARSPLPSQDEASRLAIRSPFPASRAKRSGQREHPYLSLTHLRACGWSLATSAIPHRA